MNFQKIEERYLFSKEINKDYPPFGKSHIIYILVIVDYRILNHISLQYCNREGVSVLGQDQSVKLNHKNYYDYKKNDTLEDFRLSEIDYIRAAQIELLSEIELFFKNKFQKDGESNTKQ